MKTTLNKIREYSPCANGWKKLLTNLNKTQADDEPLALLTILDSNGLDDALWCLRAVEGHEKEIRLFAVWCARQVRHLMTDPRLIAALDVAERHAHGKATDGELGAALAAASDAALAAASGAARDAAWAAERDAAWAAERAAEWGAAWAAEWAAEWGAAWAAERAAEWAAARPQARDAAWAAARDAARAAQEQQLRHVLATTTN